MGFIDNIKNKFGGSSSNSLSKEGYTLFDVYTTHHRAEVYSTSLKHSGMRTKIVESGEEYQVWYKP